MVVRRARVLVPGLLPVGQGTLGWPHVLGSGSVLFLLTPAASALLRAVGRRTEL